MHRLPVVLSVLFLTACASDSASRVDQSNIEIHAMSAGQPVAGVHCLVSTAAGRWEITPPAVVPVGPPAGDLRVACDKPGYRNSEVLYRPSPYSYGGTGGSNVGVGIGGGSGNVGVGLGFSLPIGGGGSTAGGYPPRIVVELNPQ